MIKIYAINAQRNFYSFKPNFNQDAPKTPGPKMLKTYETTISFKGKSEDAAESNPLPYEVEKAYFASKDMLQDFSDATKDAIQTGLAAQSAARDAKDKAKELLASHKGKIPPQISVQNEDGSEDVFFFTNGILNSYRKNERKTEDTTKIDKILFFKNGKLTSYEEGVVSTINKGSAKQDIEISKSLEYDKISTTYKEGFKSTGGTAETKRIVCLVFAKPWYIEEGVVVKPKEKPGRIKRRLEFSNREKTTYSYQEDIQTFSNSRTIKRSIYVEESTPYRYCEDESFSQSAYRKFDAYKSKKCLYFQDGKWQLERQY